MRSITLLCLLLLVLLAASLTEARIQYGYIGATKRLYKADNSLGVKMALDSHGDIDSKEGESGQTPLIHAIIRGNFEVAKALLEHGADVTLGENKGYTPMHAAGFQGRAKFVPLLVKYDVPVSPVHKDGLTPLMRACWGKEKRHTETVQALLDAGANPEELEKCKTSNPGTQALMDKVLDEAEKKKDAEARAEEKEV